MKQSIMESIAAEIKPSQFMSYRDFLDSVYCCLRARFVSFSYTEFSKILGLGKANMAYFIIKSHRNLSMKNVDVISKKLCLKGVEKKYFKLLVEFEHSSDPSRKEDLLKKITSAKKKLSQSNENIVSVEFFSNWLNIVLFEYFKIPWSSSDPYVICKHLTPKVTPLKVKKSMDFLQEIGLISYSEELSRFVCHETHIQMGSNVVGLTFFNFHKSALDLSQNSLHGYYEERDLHSMTFSLNLAQRDLIQNEIDNFRDKLRVILKQENQGSEFVYQLNMQYFPLTETKKKGKQK